MTDISSWFDEAAENHKADQTEKKYAIPFRVGIEITNTCNLDCLMCNTQMSTRANGFMSTEMYEDIVKDLHKTGVKLVELYTIGETFVHKELESLVEIAFSYDMEVHLSTNAQFPDRVKSLFEKFKDKSPHIFLSIDGATKKTFEYIRKGATFEKVIQTLEVLHSLNEKRSQKISMAIRSILSMANIREVQLYFDVFGKYVSDQRKINFQLINGISPDKSFFQETIPFANLIHKKPPCHMPFRNMYYTYDGKYTPCARDYNADLVVGDSKQETLNEVWNGENIQSLRDQHKAPETLQHEVCISCLDTYRIARTIANEFIHFHYANFPDESPEVLSDNLYALLELTDENIHDILTLKSKVQEFFNKFSMKKTRFAAPSLTA